MLGDRFVITAPRQQYLYLVRHLKTTLYLLAACFSHSAVGLCIWFWINLFLAYRKYANTGARGGGLGMDIPYKSKLHDCVPSWQNKRTIIRLTCYTVDHALCGVDV